MVERFFYLKIQTLGVGPRYHILAINEGNQYIKCKYCSEAEGCSVTRHYYLIGVGGQGKYGNFFCVKCLAQQIERIWDFYLPLTNAVSKFAYCRKVVNIKTIAPAVNAPNMSCRRAEYLRPDMLGRFERNSCREWPIFCVFKYTLSLIMAMSS